MNTVAKNAARTASAISAVRIVLIVFNLLAAVGLLIVGVHASSPSYSVDQYGSMDTSNNPFGIALIVLAAIVAVIGTIVIHIVFSWFADMLATNAELVRAATHDRPLQTGEKMSY